MKVGFVFNSATEEALCESPELTLNLTDAPETIAAVQQALEAGGHRVVPLNADRRLPGALAKSRFDIVFNIATGFYGDTRQANVPAMLEFLRIPHTGAGVLSETITHHKPVMKQLLLAHGLPTPAFQVLQHASEALNPALDYPLILKLPAEGGSLGMDANSVVHNESELRAQVRHLMTKYHDDVLVEKYVEGREFTVAVLGNTPPYTLPIVERQYFGDLRIQLDGPEPTTLAMYQQITGQDVEYTVIDARSVVPAELSDDEAATIRSISIDTFQMMSCQDWARIDLRMDSQGNVYVLDVNLEPAVAPDYAVAKAAEAAGWTYTELINRILDHAIDRYPQLQLQSQTVRRGRSKIYSGMVGATSS